MAASLRRLDDKIGSYVLVVCVGGDEEPRDLYTDEAWSRSYPIIWHWADREGFRRDSFWETSREIFRQPRRGRLVMCADADVIFVRDFSELLTELSASPAIAGAIAHGPPFRDVDVQQTWRDLFQSYGVLHAAAVHEHSGWGFMTREKFTPIYFNFGMVVAPGDMMQAIGAEIEAAVEFVHARITTFFRFQIALTLVIQKLQLPTRPLPLRYNFPNDPRFDDRFPEELADLRVLHYLRCEVIDRERNFATLPDVAALVARGDLWGSNEVLRRTLAEFYPAVAAEERL